MSTQGKHLPIRSAYDGSRVRVALDQKGEESRTKQAHKKECDINTIMARYLKSGNVDHLATHQGQFRINDSIDFKAAMDVVIHGQRVFNDLPSELRRRFGESPAAFLEFAQDPKNIDELRKLGLAKPLPPAATPATTPEAPQT